MHKGRHAPPSKAAQLAALIAAILAASQQIVGIEPKPREPGSGATRA